MTKVTYLLLMDLQGLDTLKTLFFGLNLIRTSPFTCNDMSNFPFEHCFYNATTLTIYICAQLNLAQSLFVHINSSNITEVKRLKHQDTFLLMQVLYLPSQVTQSRSSIA